MGTPTFLSKHDMGLSTEIASANTDGQGKPVPGSMRATVRRLRVWDNRTRIRKSADRNMKQAFGELEILASHLALSAAVKERSAYIYRKAVDRHLTRGRSITGMTAAALYAACRDFEIPRTVKDVATAANIGKKQVAYYYRLLLTELDISMPLPDPIKCLSRISSRIGVSEKTRRDALSIIRKVEQSGETAGKHPMGTAAAALYIACALQGESRTQGMIARAAGITEVTVRNRYMAIRLGLGIQRQSDVAPGTRMSKLVPSR